MNVPVDSAIHRALPARVRAPRAATLAHSLPAVCLWLATSLGLPVQAQQPLGLVAAYSFEETTGTTTADASGNGNTGTLAGATRTASGKSGWALSFDGVSALVNVPDSASLDLTTAMTLEAWVYPVALGDWRTVVMKETPSGLAYTLYANEDVANPSSWLRVGSADARVAAGPGLPLNTWTHLAATYNGTSFALYVNGTQVATQARTGSIAVSSNPLRIGGNTIWGEYFSGRIDEVRIYNRALTAAEVLTDMTLGSSPQPPKLTITAPANNSSISGSTVDVTFVSSGDLSQANHVRLSLDGGPEQVVMTLNGQLQLTELSPGAHTLTGYIAKADNTKLAGSDASPISFTVTTPPVGPVLTITSPANDSTLPSGTVSVVFATSGDLAEANHVHISVDAGPATEAMALSGSVQFTDLAAGAHTIDGYVVRADHTKIVGSDAARVNFTVAGSGPTDPATIGQWGSAVSLPTVAVNLVWLHTSKALLWAGDFSSAPNHGELWDPATNAFTPVPNPFANLFCAANVHLADGRVLVAGGHDKQNGILGIASASTFDPHTETWTALPSMANRRFYPTTTILGDGRVIVTSGASLSLDQPVETPEIYNPATNSWTTLQNARRSMPTYAMMYLLPDGRLLHVGSTERHPTTTAALNIATQQWTAIDDRPIDGGSSVMYAPGKIMKSGSASNDGETPNAASVATTYVLDMNQPAPQWRATAPMQFGRTFHNLTSLADGTVIATSGSNVKSETNSGGAVLEAELWSPATETWTTLAAGQVPRIYHASAILLPDGRVAISGSGNIGGAPDQESAEIFSPPYLFKGPRPVISGAPTLVRHGTTFVVQTPDPAGIRAVNLLRLGADTHSFDQDQRFVPLTFTTVAGGVQADAPANANLVPPGYYMLFLISNAGVPSVAKFVRFPAAYEDVTPPTAPGSLTATGSIGAVSLAWQAATDNVGVVRYEIHRSTAPDFVPSSSTLVGQSTTTTFTDAGVAAGTYFYAVIAVDAVGNTSAASNRATATVAADSVAPTVSISSPANGATLNGATTISATAGDNVAVAGVQFRLDGVALGAEDTTAPYSYAWNPGAAANGAHVLTAVARDAAGNQSQSLGVNVLVAVTAPSGLVAFYGFEEGSGTTTADNSGNGNTGAVAGAVWTTAGRVGQALSFDGVDDRVNVADSASLDLTTGMTLEAWVYPTSVTDWRTVVMKEISSGEAYLLYANDSANRPAGYVRAGGGSRSVSGSATLPVNTWSHVATTYDGTTLRVFVNGTQVGSAAVTGTITTSTLPLRIGGNAVWGEYFAGRIDEVRIYNRALSAAEIAADMSAAPAATPRLAITAPADGSTVTGTTVSASFTSSGSLTEAHHAVLQLDGGAEIPTTALNGQISIPSVEPGAHTLGGYLARADQSRIAGSDATPVQFTVAIPDTIKPTVVIAAPRDGDTVSGSVTISATASDNVAVAGVQFKLNGENLGGEDTAAPYSIVWSTSSVTNGTHVLTAVARDAASNQTQSLDVNLVVANSGSPVLAGLVAAYGFEEGTGTSTSDGSGNSNTGTVSGATWTTAGRFGNALQFDGSNDRVNVADAASLDLTTGMTLAAWVYPTSATGWRAVVMKEATSSTEAYLLYANDSANRPAGYVRAGGSLRSVRGTAALPVNTWSHVATTYDGTTLRLFVNGTQVGTLAVTGAIATSNRALRIGSKGSTRYFAGRIDEVRVFNRALSVSELQGTMNAPVVGGGTAVQPTRSSSIALDAAGRRVWVVNPDGNSVTALHADTLVKQFEIPVGRHPTSIALDASNQVWVACRDDDSVWVLDATTGALRDVLGTGWGSGPASVVFTPNGAAGFIGYQGSARVQRVTPATRQLGPTLAFASAPRALAVTADSTRLLLTRLRSGDAGGEIYSVDVNAFAAGSTISLPLDTTSVDGALAARGVPNYLVGLAIDPAGSFAWVVGKKDNIVRGALRDGQPLTFETTLRAMVGRLDLRGNQEQVARRIDLDNSSAPSAVALSANGAHAFVTVQGNNRVVVLNQLGAEVVRADTGLAPQGVVIDAATHRVFTQDFMSRTVSVFDATRLLTENIAELPRVAQVATVSAETLPAEVLRGKQIFYSADTRISRDTYISCASCHLDGEHDGRVWDFTDRGEGLRNTISLKGGGGNAGAPLHWTANFDEVQDFENDIRGFFGGTGLMSDADFFVGTRAQPLGEPKAGVSADLDALAAYVSSLTDAGFSPHRLADGALTSDAVAGRTLFSTLGCETCHSGPRLSDSNTGVRHDVGTLKPSSGSRAGGPLDGLDTPTLHGLWATAPYLHDGSAASLRDVLTTANPDGRHGATSTLSPAQVDQLVEYLQQVEPGALPGQ